MPPTLTFLLLPFVAAFLPMQNPPWQKTYNMSLSTMTMACNQSGWFLGDAAFGIASYDWSNAKAQWAIARPMDCEERLVTQGETSKLENPQTHVFLYRNLVKALPWFSTVRTKLMDPAYAGFFLKFSPEGPWGNGSYHVPACDGTYAPPLCTTFYHDQEQSPAVPSPSNPNPDGACVGTCDCGSVPCGEYLFDHRNGSMLRNWLIEEVIGGPNGMGNPAVSGFFIDDFWCSNILNGTGSCTDPVQGPTEINAYSQADMGLSDDDIKDITLGWLDTMTAAQAAIIGAGGYTWSLIPGQDNANASPVMVGPSTSSCLSYLRPACNKTTSPWSSAPLMMGMHTGNASVPLAYITQDVAAFLLMRQDYAYLGYGQWGMTWPAGTTWKGLPRPIEMDTNYGTPLEDACTEGPTGVFSRAYSNAGVTLDCNTWTATISMSHAQ